MSPAVLRHPATPYVAPFAVFAILLIVGPRLPIGAWEYPLRVAILSVTLAVFSRHTIDLRMARPLGSILLGAAIFLVWIAPDALWPGYRGHWLFQNPITGELIRSLSEGPRMDLMTLVSRTIRAVVLVPIIEELFWRGWLMRWLIRDDFKTVPLGAYTVRAFWITALLFASEHGPYWEVGLLAGAAYNWWIVRTKKLGDCILAHAVTNGLLSGYVIAAGKWQYWL